jgi:DNA helicase-2/ATP-dependent DNA helicase PcrA
MPLTTYEEIVTNYSSPTLVLAGPGAGKTYLLADRVSRTLKAGVDKNCITVLAFGTDASHHMFRKLVDENDAFKLKPDDLPRIRTMHSLGMEIVGDNAHQMHLLKTNLRVQQNENARKLLFRDAALILGFAEQDSEESRLCKERGDCDENAENRKCKICLKYREIMAKCNYVDFDDQILFACRILESSPDALKKYQSAAQHLLVDEYQDINPAQFKLIELLTRESRNGLFVVGDDAQSIYAFRGGDPKFILRFCEDYPTGVVCTLSESRRCHRHIMTDAFAVLTKHYPDWTGEPALTYRVPDGEIPSIMQFPSELAEAEKVASIAKRSIPLKTVLILAPKKEFFPLLSKALDDHGVPHGQPSELLPESIDDLGVYLDFLATPTDSFRARVAIEHLINTGPAKIPGAKKDKRCTAATIAKRIEVEREIANMWEDVGRKCPLFSAFESRQNPTEPVAKVRDCMSNLLRLYTSTHKADQQDFVRELSVASDTWNEPSKLAKDIRKLTNLLSPQRGFGPGSVQMMTMRKAKGLEADVVIVVGLEDDIVPNQRSNNEQEEARLLYVSMTRAKQELFLFHSCKRPRNITYGIDLLGKTRSRFLEAIGRRSTYIPSNK